MITVHGYITKKPNLPYIPEQAVGAELIIKPGWNRAALSAAPAFSNLSNQTLMFNYITAAAPATPVPVWGELPFPAGLTMAFPAPALSQLPHISTGEESLIHSMVQMHISSL